MKKCISPVIFISLIPLTQLGPFTVPELSERRQTKLKTTTKNKINPQPDRRCLTAGRVGQLSGEPSLSTCHQPQTLNSQQWTLNKYMTKINFLLYSLICLCLKDDSSIYRYWMRVTKVSNLTEVDGSKNFPSVKRGLFIEIPPASSMVSEKSI